MSTPFFTLSLCITNFNRTDDLERSFQSAVDDARISEIIICDDNSNKETCRFLYMMAKNYPKISLYFHPENVGMYENKKRAISYANNEWCILLDSDNVLWRSYLDGFYELAFRQTIYNKVIYCPDFAFPNFDYRTFGGYSFNLSEAKKYIHMALFETLLNTCNYIVNKESYLKVWEPASEVGAADSIFFMYLWLKAGYVFYVVNNMQYDHTVHAGSGFLKDVKSNMEKAKKIKNLIINL